MSLLITGFWADLVLYTVVDGESKPAATQVQHKTMRELYFLHLPPKGVGEEKGNKNMLKPSTYIGYSRQDLGSRDQRSDF